MSQYPLSDEQLFHVVRDWAMRNPKAAAEHDFGFFCLYYLQPHFDQGFAEFQYDLYWLLNQLRSGQNILALFAREHGKSTLFTFAFNLWCICYRKKKFIVIPSAVKDTAEKFLANIKSELEYNSLIQRDFGDLVGDLNRQQDKKNARFWRASFIHTTNHVVVMITSVRGTVRGLVQNLPEDLNRDFLGTNPRTGEPVYRTKSIRPDLILLDDALDDKSIGTPETRNKTWDWFWKNAFSAMGMGKGNVIIVGTTLHDDDLVMRLWRDKKQTPGIVVDFGEKLRDKWKTYAGRPPWVKLKLPACDPDNPFDENGMPNGCLFPEKWGRLDYSRPIYTRNPETGQTETKYFSFLWWRAKELGPAFDPEFLMRPISSSTRYFNIDDLQEYVVAGRIEGTEVFTAYHNTTGKYLEYLPGDLICVTSVDPAAVDEARVKVGSDPDYTAIETWGFSPSRQRFYLVAVDHGRFKPGQIIQRTLVHCQMFNQHFGGKFIPDKDKPHEYLAGFPFFHLGVAIETVAFQKALATLFEEMATALGYYPTVFEMNRGSQHGKLLRAMLPAHLASQKLLSIPYQLVGQPSEAVDALIEEFRMFPGGPHDDLVDAAVDAITVLHSYSLQLGRGLTGLQAVQELLSGNFAFSVSAEQAYAAVQQQFGEGPQMPGPAHQVPPVPPGYTSS